MMDMAHTASLQEIWGGNVRTARLAQGLSVVRLAQLASADPSGISRFERGIHGAGDDMRVRLARALNLPAEQLFPYPPTTTEAEGTEPKVKCYLCQGCDLCEQSGELDAEHMPDVLCHCPGDRCVC